MHVDSLAFRTDLALLELAGSEVEDQGTHVAVRTPANPSYWWGNFLLLPRAPSAEELPGWESVFASTFPTTGHRAYGVATAHGTREDLAGFSTAGLEVDVLTVMTTTAVHEPPRPQHEATYRPLVDDADWEQQVALALAGEEASTGRDFVLAKASAQRSLTRRGIGEWWGAFVGDRLLSSMGLFAASPGLARFQDVKTHPDARGQGLAGSLVHEVSRFGLDELGAETLVMVADPGYLAIRIYRSVGFEDTETQLQAQAKPA